MLCWLHEICPTHSIQLAYHMVQYLWHIIIGLYESDKSQWRSLSLLVYLVFFKKLEFDNKITLQAFISLPMQLQGRFNLTNFH